MRKLYSHNKGKIHPSPPTSSATNTTDHLSLLPFAIASLAAALSPEDKQVLAYLLSVTTTNINRNNFSGSTTKLTTKTSGGDGGGSGSTHPPRFDCDCFSCYTSYWVRWDASPNQQLIHEIIDAYEDGLIPNKKSSGKSKKERKKNKVSPSSISSHAPITAAEKASDAPPQVEENTTGNEGDYGDQEELIVGSSSEKGPVRKFVNFLGERIWGVWGV